MTPETLQILYGFAGGFCAFLLVALLSTAVLAFWIGRAPFFDEDAYLHGRPAELDPTQKEAPHA